MQDIKEHMMEQLDACHVYDNINTTKDALRHGIDKKSRDLSSLKSSNRPSLQPDEGKTTSPLKRAKSALMNKQAVNHEKRSTFTTDPRKGEGLTISRQHAKSK